MPTPPPARSLNTIFRSENWNLVGHQTHSANRSSTMFDVCERVVLVLCRWRSVPENRKWSSQGVVILLFATKSVHVACFTDTKQTWFALSDETPAHAMTPAKFYPIGIQYLHKLQLPDLLQDKFERGWYDAQHQFGTHIDLLWLLCLVGRICPLMREHFLWPLLNVKLFIAAE